jgi:hypothetical protein
MLCGKGIRIRSSVAMRSCQLLWLRALKYGVPVGEYRQRLLATRSLIDT